jgi:hypothetical protein
MPFSVYHSSVLIVWPLQCLKNSLPSSLSLYLLLYTSQFWSDSHRIMNIVFMTENNLIVVRASITSYCLFFRSFLLVPFPLGSDILRTYGKHNIVLRRVMYDVVVVVVVTSHVFHSQKQLRYGSHEPAFLYLNAGMNAL